MLLQKQINVEEWKVWEKGQWDWQVILEEKGYRFYDQRKTVNMCGNINESKSEAGLKVGGVQNMYLKQYIQERWLFPVQKSLIDKCWNQEWSCVPRNSRVCGLFSWCCLIYCYSTLVILQMVRRISWYKFERRC